MLKLIKSGSRAALSLVVLLLLTTIAAAGNTYGLAAKWGAAGTSNGKLSYPCGIAVDVSGNVFVADLCNNRIQKFDAHGKFVCLLKCT